MVSEAMQKSWDRQHKQMTKQYTDSPLVNSEVKERVEKIIKEKNKELAKEKFKVLSMKELQDYESPTYTWRIQNLVQDKKIIIVAGGSAVCKSWLCLNAGLSVAGGTSFLENFSVEQGGALFIDRENSIPELQNRVEMVAKGMGIDVKELPLYFLSEQSIMLDNPEALDFLEGFIQENNIRLVIVDVYRRVISFEENDANSVSFFFTECLKPICEKTGASFMFIHHHKKGRSDGNEKDMLRGSSDLVNFVDGVLQITRKGNNLTVKQTKNRSGKELEPFNLEIETDEEEYFRFKYLGEKMDNSKLAQAVETMILWITQNKIEKFKTQEARNYCSDKGVKRVKFYEALDELIKRGIIEKSEYAHYSVCGTNQDSETVQCPPLKGCGQLDTSVSVKSNSFQSSNGQSGQLDTSKVKTPKKKESTRDLHYSEDPVTANIIDCDKDEVLAYHKKHPKTKIDTLIKKFGPGVMKLKKEGLIK